VPDRPTDAVRDYPRPPRLEPAHRRVRVVLGGNTIAETSAAWRVLETFHPPTYYLPPNAFLPGTIGPGHGRSFCEWKGHARYWSLRSGDRLAENAAWSYPEPTPAFAPIADHLALYASAVDACYLDDELVRPQPGGFYGGWITRELIGPFKGEPGTQGW
jgi:uncharacterized protein (DUF427 family)